MDRRVVDRWPALSPTRGVRFSGGNRVGSGIQELAMLETAIEDAQTMRPTVQQLRCWIPVARCAPAATDFLSLALYVERRRR
jgi:hypothetical protein